jgi:hypothetical protein
MYCIHYTNLINTQVLGDDTYKIIKSDLFGTDQGSVP